MKLIKTSYDKILDHLNPKLKMNILNYYYRSLIYRKKHIRKNRFNWLKEIELNLLNNKEGQLDYKGLKFILSKNNLKDIPLHQKYLYASLITNFDIPNNYLLFWDDLDIFHEIFIDNLYDKLFIPKKGDIVLDIGASRGWYACKISEQVGEQGRIIAIEPDPNNFYFLKKNIEINKLNNITPLNLGVWSKKRELILNTNKYASQIEIVRNSSKNSRIHTKVDKIDNIFANLNLEKISLIKIDIEGAEIEAIKGAFKVLSNSKDICLIIAAYHKIVRGIESYKYLVPFLEKSNFKVYKEYLPFIYAKKV